MNRDERNSRSDLARQLVEVGVVEFGEFTYASGAKGPIYVDLRRLVSHPSLLNAVCRSLADLVSSSVTVDLWMGAATAGIPFSTLMSVHSGLPMVYIRKQAKEHGKGARIEGVWHPGQRAVLVDDLVTSGASKEEFVTGAREAGLVVETVAVVLDRRPDDDGGIVDSLGVRMLSLLTLRELVAAAQTAGIAADEDVTRVDAWLKGGAW